MNTTQTERDPEPDAHKPIARKCSRCGCNMVPHHRQTYRDSVWLVCESWNCDNTGMIPAENPKPEN